MPAERSAKRILGAGSAASGRLSKNVQVQPCQCNICGQVISRASDMSRHKKRHDPTAEKFLCPWEGCDYNCLQKSNLDTHYLRHTGEKPHVCTDSIYCFFETCDRSHLLRHRKSDHGYIPEFCADMERLDN